MKIIRPSVEFLGAVPTDYENTLRFIERAGRTCYKSEDKITSDSAKKFVRGLIRREHLAMVEHSNFVIRAERGSIVNSVKKLPAVTGKYLNSGFVRHYAYIGGSLTAWYDRWLWRHTLDASDEALYTLADLLVPFRAVYGNLFELDKTNITMSAWEVCPHDEIPKELHRYSARFFCDRGVSHELVRHRPCSFAQESTRYVNYGGKDMEFIEPFWWDEPEYEGSGHETFALACRYAEMTYNELRKLGAPPQAARAVLPNALKTELIVTADAAEWAHIRKLRTAKDAHPDMQRVMNMLPWEEMI